MEIKEITKHIISTSMPIMIVGSLNCEMLPSAMKIGVEDYLIISEETVKIEHIREGIKFLQFKPLKSAHRLLIVAGAENMTAQAANALLKTLEEAPGESRLILVTRDAEKLLPTIHSRCQKIYLAASKDFLIPENYLSPEELKKMALVDRFNFAKNVAEEGNAQEILTLWQAFYREKMLFGEDVLKPLKRIEEAKGLLETNISVKLLLENLLMEL